MGGYSIPFDDEGPKSVRCLGKVYATIKDRSSLRYVVEG